MTAKEMLGKVDHTQLKAFATWEDIQDRKSTRLNSSHM